MGDIFIRSPSEADFEAMAAIFDDEMVVAQTGQIPGENGKFWGEFYRKRDPNAVEFVAEIDGRIVGHLGILTNAAPRRKHAASFGIGVLQSHQGKGVGSALMAAMLDMTDNWLNIVRLELSVFADNVPAIALYEKFGFEREGIARSAIFRNGRYADLLAMARIRPVRS